MKHPKPTLDQLMDAVKTAFDYYASDDRQLAADMEAARNARFNLSLRLRNLRYRFSSMNHNGNALDAAWNALDAVLAKQGANVPMALADKRRNEIHESVLCDAIAELSGDLFEPPKTPKEK